MLQEVHSFSTGGHLGVAKTLEARFCWPEQKKDSEDWCSQCKVSRSRNMPVPSPHALCPTPATADRTANGESGNGCTSSTTPDSSQQQICSGIRRLFYKVERHMQCLTWKQQPWQHVLLISLCAALESLSNCTLTKGEILNPYWLKNLQHAGNC